VSLGLADRQGNLLDDMEQFCERALAETSIYSVLHKERDRLFPDDLFADLFSDKGRRSVPPSVVATVMVLQRLEGLSDRIRGVFKVAAEREAELRGLCASGDDYASSAKPQIDWDDAEARAALVDSRAKDGYALLAHLDGEELVVLPINTMV
jgi:hypothetical protein